MNPAASEEIILPRVEQVGLFRFLLLFFLFPK